MDKFTRAEQVIKALNSSGRSWTILSSDEDTPTHIRVDGFGDVWPTSGTFKGKNGYVRRNHSKLMKAINSQVERSELSKDTRIEDLEQLMIELREHVSQLEDEVIGLRLRLG